ncbi:MAG TPA: DUF1415 domain-containing protein [Gemmataceae bacterium]|nr:DUF1415 domain-containing protein [Gemmataceae bacterium]
MTAKPEAEVIAILDKPAILEATERWISSIVIGLNLCPFANRVHQGNLIRYVVSDAVDSEALRSDLADELKLLTSTPIESIETTVVIHPDVLQRFDDYCDFLVEAQRLVNAHGYRGVVQIVGFHPAYQFENAEPEAVENGTNRSPYPMLHLLREESISKVAGDPAELLEIPKRNAALLRSMGRDKFSKLLAEIVPKERTHAF